jgi:hypothetical protein
MCAFADWCSETEVEIGAHSLTVLNATAAKLQVGRDAIAAVLPTHYASEERIAELLDKLGKSASAQYIRQKLPEGPQIRSGDLGEIFAAEYVAERTTYTVPIRRLRWRDHRNMAMRGDDIIAVEFTGHNPPLEFLKAEAKSYAHLAEAVVKKARNALDNDNGLPSAHALSFVADRLVRSVISLWRMRSMRPNLFAESDPRRSATCYLFFAATILLTGLAPTSRVIAARSPNWQSV